MSDEPKAEDIRVELGPFNSYVHVETVNKETGQVTKTKVIDPDTKLPIPLFPKKRAIYMHVGDARREQIGEVDAVEGAVVFFHRNFTDSLASYLRGKVEQAVGLELGRLRQPADLPDQEEVDNATYDETFGSGLILPDGYDDEEE